MIEIEIPGSEKRILKYLVLDYNGTLAVDGEMLDKVREKLYLISKLVDIHVITADTFGKAAEHLKEIPCKLKILDGVDHQQLKSDYIKKLGRKHVVAIGNGVNDALMLKDSSIGVVVIQNEGAAVVTLLAADIVCKNILDALDLLLNPERIKATLRS